jgi:putative membrane protein
MAGVSRRGTTLAAVGSGPSLLTSWRLEPLQLVPLVLVGLLYARRVRTLRGRGTEVESWRLWSFGTGLALLFLALASPIDAFGEEQFLSFHMLQHMLIGDLAPLAMVAGLTGPILRPVLSLRWIGDLRALAHPLIALPLWAIDLGVWHVPYLYEGALHHDALHALEHACFFGFGALMWAPVIEVLPAPAWFGTGIKVGYIVCVRIFETILGNVFLWAGSVFYPFYEQPTERWGISALSDQGIAGGVMMLEGSLVTIGALAWLVLRLAGESELRQELIEAGADPAAAARAVRYRRGKELRAGR